MAEQERWTPKVGQSYYYVSFFHEVPTASIGLREEDPFDDLKIKQLNCYQTYVEAQTAADEMRKVLLRHAGELHDLQWAISEMKKGNALTLPLRSEVFTYTPEYDGLCETCYNFLLEKGCLAIYRDIKAVKVMEDMGGAYLVQPLG